MIHFDSKEDRFVFIYLLARELFVNGQKLVQGNQARLDKEGKLHLETASSAGFVLIDVPPNRENI